MFHFILYERREEEKKPVSILIRFLYWTKKQNFM